MYSLNDTIEISGEWWDSKHPDKIIPGQLSFTRHKGVELLVNHAFNPPYGAVRPGDPNLRYACIHGITVSGEAATLVDAQQLGTSFNFGSGGIRQPGRIHARILVMGAHLPEQFCFSKIIFKVPNLQVWLSHKVIHHTIHLDQEDKFIRQDYIIEHIPDEEFQIQTIASIISIHYRGKSNSNAYSSAQLSVEAWLGVKPDTPHTIDWFLEQIDKLLTLITFLSGQFMATDSIEAQINSSDEVSILFANKESETPKKKYPSDYFLSRSSISTPFSECCNKWFDIAKKIERPADLAISIIASKNLWLHIEFISLIQALEGLHRALYNGKYMEDGAYEVVRDKLQNAIPSNVSKDHRTSLKSRVRYGNQYSLRKRLGELGEHLSEEIRRHIFGPTKSVPATWVDTRNYYTHWDEELKYSILDNQDMHYANIRLNNFLITLFRLLAGVSPSDIESAYSGTSDSAQQLIEVNIVTRRKADPHFIPQAIMTISSNHNDKEIESPSSSTKGKNNSSDEGI